ncbi:hypothetical protein HGM15179_005519 [Zosterops borbonicus]|uniref:Dickkopf N-terminal cysteine-rich domain-containing protein n=1 Tax=Zosterops borbonicus TaxID=364589 RepID=A0A8K1GM65_9PASS|nr:hypothetical protein HGM15179_005519 [Zosterops borbonicus]
MPRAPRPAPAGLQEEERRRRRRRRKTAVLIVESSQLDSSSSKVNSIKSTLMGEAPTQATNRSAGIHQGLMLASSKKGKMLEQMGKPPKHYHRQGEAYPCTNDKECEVGRYCHSPHQATSACMMCRRKKKRCHRDGMCCPGNRCNNGICIPVTESILTPHIPALEGPRNKKNGHYASKDLGWHNMGRSRSKLSHIKDEEDTSSPSHSNASREIVETETFTETAKVINSSNQLH